MRRIPDTGRRVVTGALSIILWSLVLKKITNLQLINAMLLVCSLLLLFYIANRSGTSIVDLSFVESAAVVISLFTLASILFERHKKERSDFLNKPVSDKTGSIIIGFVSLVFIAIMVSMFLLVLFFAKSLILLLYSMVILSSVFFVEKSLNRLFPLGYLLWRAILSFIALWVFLLPIFVFK